MKTLVIAEKPSVARDIARVLGCSKKENGALEGNKYIVTWALGHLVTLKDPEDYDKKYKEWNMAVLPMMPEKLQIKVIPQTGKQYHAVTTQLARKDVNEIVIATDAGREGELVARWILDKAHNQKPCKRLWISSVTDKAIREGFANLKDAKEYDNLYRAAVSRAEADWLVGINATRALTCKYNAQLSCGRVQTPTLAMIAQREQEIREFVPKPYYTVTAAAGGVVYTWKDEKSGGTRISDPEKAKQIALEDAGLDEAAQKIVFTREELSRNSGKPCYILEFYTDKCAYSYKVDAVSGDILEKNIEWRSLQESEPVSETVQSSDSNQRRIG